MVKQKDGKKEQKTDEEGFIKVERGIKQKGKSPVTTVIGNSFVVLQTAQEMGETSGGGGVPPVSNG